MRRRFSCRGDKNGGMALEALVTILLSVVAIFVLLNLFVNLFLHTPTNLKIAQDNAKSIVEFVDFSKRHYGKSNECFTLLRLKNLENFQVETGNQIYFYIIDKKGVYILKKETFQLILEGESDESTIRSNSVKPYYFGNKEYELNILMEKLSGVQVIGDILRWLHDTLNVLTWLSDEKTNPQLEKDFFYRTELISSDYIILIPKFGKELLGYDISIGDKWGFIELLKDNQNTLKALNHERFSGAGNRILNEFYYESHYLVYKPDKNIFPSYTSASEHFIKQNLCEFDNYLLDISTKRHRNIEGYDDELNKYKVYEFNDYKIIVRNNDPICLLNNKQVECRGKSGERIKSFDVDSIKKEFEVEEISESFVDKTEEEFLLDLFTPINFAKKITKRDFDVDLVFSFDFLQSFADRNPNYKVYELEGYNLNDCREDICNYLLYNFRSGVMYFYDNKYSNDFVSFDISYLFKDKLDDPNPDRNVLFASEEIPRWKEIYKIFFNVNEKGELREIDFDIRRFDRNWAYGGDRYFFILDIPIPNSGEVYKVVISKEQWNKISPKLAER